MDVSLLNVPITLPSELQTEQAQLPALVLSVPAPKGSSQPSQSANLGLESPEMKCFKLKSPSRFKIETKKVNFKSTLIFRP